jgi:hypothetical protein
VLATIGAIVVEMSLPDPDLKRIEQASEAGAG